MTALETYLSELRAIRSFGAGTKETSFYPALAVLLNEVGKTLSPRVHCIVHIQNAGAGIPDIGLFTVDQAAVAPEDPIQRGLVPARGVVEAKGASVRVRSVAESDQVRRYLDRYGQVLITNLWEFLLVERGQQGQLVLAESYSLASSEAEFWSAAADPAMVRATQGDRFEQYLRRVLMQRAVLTAPEDVAFYLASYAREAKARIEGRSLPELAAVRQALEEGLGLSFEGPRGDHFFRSTLVQTLFYGLFSAWVLWCKQNIEPTRRFGWRTTLYLLRVPAIRALFQQVASPYALEPFDLVEVLDWASEMLNRVDRASFFTQFQEEHAIQYFYEPF